MGGAEKAWDRKVILYKEETTEGTDAAPTTAANALQVLNYRPVFMDADQKIRPLEKAFLGANPVALANFKRGASFDMEWRGSGTTAATPAAWAQLLKIAGFGAPVVNGAISVSQSPTSSPVSGTHWAYLDDLLLKTIGARATLGFSIVDDEVPLWSLSLLGRAPATLAEQAAPGAATITGFDAIPLVASTENTTFTLDGFALPLRSWEMSNGADLQFRSLIGVQDRVIMRDRPWTGSIVAQVPDLTAKDYFAKARPGTTMVANVVHGAAAGNIVEVNTPKLQITGNIEISEEQGRLMMTLPVTALPVAGNDEIVVTTK